MSAQIQEQSEAEVHVHPNEEAHNHPNEPNTSSSSFKYRVFDAIVILSFVACMFYTGYLRHDSKLVQSLQSLSPIKSPNSISRDVRNLKDIIKSIAEEEDFLHSFVSTGDEDEEDDKDADIDEQDGEGTSIDDSEDSEDEATEPFHIGEIVQVLITESGIDYYIPAHVRHVILDRSGMYRYDLTSAIHGYRTMDNVDATHITPIFPRNENNDDSETMVLPTNAEAVCHFKLPVPCTVIYFHGEECISVGGCYEVLSRWEDEIPDTTETAERTKNNGNLRGAGAEIERRIPLDRVQLRVDALKSNFVSSVKPSNDMLQLEERVSVDMARRDEAKDEPENR